MFTKISSLLITLFIFPIETIKVHHHGKIKKAEETCGHPLGMVSGKIVGGYDIGYYKYPWFVSLYKDGMPYCGATLVTKKSIVTAAHCYQQYLDNPKGIENEYELKMGTYNICDTHESTLKTYQPKKVYIHEKYENEDPFYDIALIVLKENVGFEPACLPSKPYGNKERPKEAFIAGYGVLKFQDYKTSCVMREARVKIYSDKQCKKMIHKNDPDVNNFANAFCAGYLEGGVDACQGDSGGPLMVLTSGSRFILLGLTSFGYKCADKNLLGVYTDVSKFLDWIHAKTNDEDGDSDEDSDEDENSDEDEDNDEDGSSGEDEDSDEDNDDNDDDSDEDDQKKKKKKLKKKSKLETLTKKKKNHHKKHHKKHNKKHLHTEHGKNQKKSMRTKTVFEIRKMNKKKSKLNKNEDS